MPHDFLSIEQLRRQLMLLETRQFRRFDRATGKFDEQAQADDIASLKQLIETESRAVRPVADDLAAIFKERARYWREVAAEHSDDVRQFEEAANRANCFDHLDATRGEVDPAVLQHYAKLTKDFTGRELCADLLQQVGFDWQPANATEFVTKCVARATKPSEG
ncbi:hypothetical protein [Bradyrhizobium genosp. A]|uniref:hypothetical protein n=1 Tax=Bradyrhizobium genosp. A TaxID=83626 RepID=UPI003CF79B1D